MALIVFVVLAVINLGFLLAGLANIFDGNGGIWFMSAPINAVAVFLCLLIVRKELS